MITGKVSELGKYIGEDQAKLIREFIQEVKRDPVFGQFKVLSDQLRGIVLHKSNFKENVFEAHRRDEDIHIVLQGEDLMILGDEDLAEVTTPYVAQDDYTLFNSESIGTIKVSADQFVMLMRDEIHTNLITNEETIKIVIKRIHG